MLALPLVIVCYVLVNVAYLSVMSAAQIASSSAVAVVRLHPPFLKAHIFLLVNSNQDGIYFNSLYFQEFGEIVLGRFAWIMPLAVVLSTFGAANGTEFTAGR